MLGPYGRAQLTFAAHAAGLTARRLLQGMERRRHRSFKDLTREFLAHTAHAALARDAQTLGSRLRQQRGVGKPPAGAAAFAAADGWAGAASHAVSLA
jgi:hypothetical protein